MDVTAFYATVSTLCFTVLGLWWVACQARNEWLTEVGGRKMAEAILLTLLVVMGVQAAWLLTFLPSRT